jgi:hypothetical protein
MRTTITDPVLPDLWGGHHCRVNLLLMSLKRLESISPMRFALDDAPLLCDEPDQKPPAGKRLFSRAVLIIRAFPNAQTQNRNLQKRALKSHGK